MDYQTFFAEIADWIMQANQMAMKYGMHSDTFWNWVSSSSGDLCTKYKNNQLVIRQMVMLVEWLDDFYKDSQMNR